MLFRSLMPFDTVLAHLVSAVAVGVFAQGAFAAGMGTMLFPSSSTSTSTSNLFRASGVPKVGRSRRTRRFKTRPTPERADEELFPEG